ncbi:MAG TPA: hypothetical protein VG986_01205 [Pseudolabrys sp.]|nr:hypothetical protein [Pseudolabrys sp.]
MMLAVGLALAAPMLAASPAAATFVQLGHKLIGTGAKGNAAQAYAVALSADGNTMAVGSPYDNSDGGAVWIFIRKNNAWQQQGGKLAPTSASGAGAMRGAAVALSNNGNTLLVGAPSDNYGAGGAWIFTRSGSVWHQGPKILGSGAAGAAGQGTGVALSSDGNTAIIGGPNDNSGIGAAWVFTRSGSQWKQQGRKLVGSHVVGYGPQQGTSVALSSNGNTAIVGGPNDGKYDLQGAVWVFTRANSVWRYQAKLVAKGVTSGCCAGLGTSVALSANGNTAIVGGPDDPAGGAAWVFTRAGTAWTQQGNKLAGTGVTGSSAWQGQSVALSANGNIAVVGGDQDNKGNVGAAWVFTRSGAVWKQSGKKLVGSGYVFVPPVGIFEGHSVAMSATGTTLVLGGYGDRKLGGASWVFISK